MLDSNGKKTLAGWLVAKHNIRTDRFYCRCTDRFSQDFGSVQHVAVGMRPNWIRLGKSRVKSDCLGSFDCVFFWYVRVVRLWLCFVAELTSPDQKKKRANDPLSAEAGKSSAKWRHYDQKQCGGGRTLPTPSRCPNWSKMTSYPTGGQSAPR